VKLPTQPRHLRIDIVPRIGRFSTERMVWWIEPLQCLLLVAAPAFVFQYAGGTADQVAAWFNTTLDAPTQRAALHLLAAPPQPLVLALAVLFAAAAVASLAELQGRRSERRHFHRWYAARHPEDVPGNAVAGFVQEILRDQGPLNPFDILKFLAAGGTWGPPVQVSYYGLLNGVLLPGGRTPAWLADRRPGWPWSLRENPYAPVDKESASVILERLVLMHGPLRWCDLVDLLRRGGAHGRPVMVSKQTVGKMLDRAAWLKPRELGGLYEHIGAEAEAAR
jgi:hypothetical protein